jgi:hypothetical protein
MDSFIFTKYIVVRNNRKKFEFKYSKVTGAVFYILTKTFVQQGTGKLEPLVVPFNAVCC